jgi:hypothetical protein
MATYDIMYIPKTEIHYIVRKLFFSFINRHWLRLPGLGNNNEKLRLPERLSAGIQFRFRNLFHGKISGNRNFICYYYPEVLGISLLDIKN